MKRREFIALLGGAAAWPARAQMNERVRLIGVLTGFGETEMRPLLSVFQARLKALGWTDDRVVIDTRMAAGEFGRMVADAEQLLALNPDVILAQGTPGVMAVRRHSKTVPIVFTLVADPVRLGLVESLSRPGGNATGLTNFEFEIASKWLELLKQIDTLVTKAVFIAHPVNPNIVGFSREIESAGRALGVEVATAQVRNTADIEAALSGVAGQPNLGVIAHPDFLITNNRKTIIELTARHRLPAIYPFRIFPTEGGLLSYGVDFAEIYRQAAGYVDSILRGKKPADLPVQAPTKFELVINLRTAKALGLEVPATLLARADEVIE